MEKFQNARRVHSVRYPCFAFSLFFICILLSCEPMTAGQNSEAYVQICMEGVPHSVGKSLFQDVTHVEFMIIQDSDSTSAGSGNLEYDEASGKYRGSIRVNTSGTLTFIGLAKDQCGRVLYFGNGSVNIFPSSSNSVTIMTETTGETGSALGKRGPAGGYIFFAADEYLDVGGYSFRFLESAPQDAPSLLRWGSRGSIGSTARGTALGHGRINTDSILEILGNSDSYAAGCCGNFECNGFSDWFLPSKDELALMYSKLKTREIGDFPDAWYWSSTETGQNYANERNFYNGAFSDYADKSTISNRVRAARYF